MSDRWKEIVLKGGLYWVVIPASLGALAYFTVGWVITRNSPKEDTAVAPVPQQITRPVRGDSKETWTMPDPPQIDISVEKVEDKPEEAEPPVDAAPVKIEVPEGEEVDEASVGGFVKPPEGGGSSTDEGETPPPTSDDGGDVTSK